ncbi:hypothetical protein YK56LOC_64600 [Caballeronia sp. HLA56]
MWMVNVTSSCELLRSAYEADVPESASAATSAANAVLRKLRLCMMIPEGKKVSLIMLAGYAKADRFAPISCVHLNHAVFRTA